MGRLILLFPILEIITTIRIGSEIGFMNTVFAFVAGGILGFGIVKSQGRFLMGGFQASLQRGEIPANQALHSMLIFVGGLAIMVPGFLSDVVGLLFVLPGSRHLIGRYLKKTLERKMQSGTFHVFTSGQWSPFGSPPNAPGADDVVRDVSPREIRGDVIEADVVSSSSRSADDSSDHDSN